MYWDYYLMGIILLPAIIFVCIAKAKESSTKKKYSKVNSENGLTARQVAELMLQKNGIHNVEVRRVKGQLTDYYSDKDKVVALSEGVYDSSSVSAISVAMHEVGHALQYADGYTPIKFRNLMVKVCNLSSRLLWPLVILGLIFNLGVENGGVLGSIFLWAGIGFFSFSIIFNLITLPVEYNASRRAKQLMKTEGILTDNELSQASEVLNSAALTYVASLVVSMLDLVRFLIVIFGSRKNRD